MCTECFHLFQDVTILHVYRHLMRFDYDSSKDTLLFWAREQALCLAEHPDKETQPTCSVGRLAYVDDEIAWHVAEINRAFMRNNIPVRTRFSCSGHLYQALEVQKSYELPYLVLSLQSSTYVPYLIEIAQRIDYLLHKDTLGKALNLNFICRADQYEYWIGYESKNWATTRDGPYEELFKWPLHYMPNIALLLGTLFKQFMLDVTNYHRDF